MSIEIERIKMLQDDEYERNIILMKNKDLEKTENQKHKNIILIKDLTNIEKQKIIDREIKRISVESVLDKLGIYK